MKFYIFIVAVSVIIKIKMQICKRYSVKLQNCNKVLFKRSIATDLEIISTLGNVYYSLVPLIALVAKNTEELFVTRISAIIDLKISNMRTPHVVPELEFTCFTSLPEEWTDQVCISKDGGTICYFSVHIVTWNKVSKQTPKYVTSRKVPKERNLLARISFCFPPIIVCAPCFTSSIKNIQNNLQGTSEVGQHCKKAPKPIFKK